MTVFLQNARSVLRVSHGTVPGPAGGGPVTAPARRLWPTSSMLPVCGRCGSLGGSCPLAPLGAATKVRATPVTTDSASRLPDRMANLLLLGRCRAAAGGPPPPPSSTRRPTELPAIDGKRRSGACQGVVSASGTQPEGRRPDRAGRDHLTNASRGQETPARTTKVGELSATPPGAAVVGRSSSHPGEKGVGGGQTAGTQHDAARRRLATSRSPLLVR